MDAPFGSAADSGLHGKLLHKIAPEVVRAGLRRKAFVEAILSKSYLPMPVSVTVCGLLPPSSATFKVAVRDPLTLGVKVTVTVQDPPGGMGLLTTQLSDSE